MDAPAAYVASACCCSSGGRAGFCAAVQDAVENGRASARCRRRSSPRRCRSTRARRRSPRSSEGLPPRRGRRACRRGAGTSRRPRRGRPRREPPPTRGPARRRGRRGCAGSSRPEATTARSVSFTRNRARRATEFPALGVARGHRQVARSGVRRGADEHEARPGRGRPVEPRGEGPLLLERGVEGVLRGLEAVRGVPGEARAPGDALLAEPQAHLLAPPVLRVALADHPVGLVALRAPRPLDVATEDGPEGAVRLPPADRETAEARVGIEAEDVVPVERRRGAAVGEALDAELELAGLGERPRRSEPAEGPSLWLRIGLHRPGAPREPTSHEGSPAPALRLRIPAAVPLPAVAPSQLTPTPRARGTRGRRAGRRASGRPGWSGTRAGCASPRRRGSPSS